MNDKIYMRIVSIICEYHSWIRVADHKLYMEHFISLDDTVVSCTCRTLVLEACLACYPYRQGHKWYIPDIELKAALVKYGKKNKGFKERINDNVMAMTKEDVEDIINIATDGLVHLNLEDM